MRMRNGRAAMARLLGVLCGLGAGLCGVLAGVGNSAGNAAQGAQEEHVYYPGKWQFVTELLATSNRANELAMLWGAAAVAIGVALYLYVRYGAGVRAPYVVGGLLAGLALAGMGFVLGAQLDSQLYSYL